MIGQEKIINSLQKFYIQDRMPTTYLLTGERGSGKTTLARIMMIAFQCPHQGKEWGNPCKICRSRKRDFSLFEINAAEMTGKDEIQKLLQHSDWGLVGRGKKRVFFFDEVHAVSRESKQMLLKYTEPEEENEQNIWILGTSKPESLPDSLSSRGQLFAMHPFGVDETTKLVNRLLKRMDSELDPDVLIEALQEKKITSPRLIVQAVDRYLVDEDVDSATNVAGVTDAHTKELCRNLIKGDWSGVVQIINGSPNANARALRVAVVGYLKSVLLDCAEIDSKSKAIGRSIKRLSYVGFAEDLVQMSALLAELQTVCDLMGRYV